VVGRDRRARRGQRSAPFLPADSVPKNPVQTNSLVLDESIR